MLLFLVRSISHIARILMCLVVLIHDAGHVFLRDDIITVDIKRRKHIRNIRFMNPWQMQQTDFATFVAQGMGM